MATVFGVFLIHLLEPLGNPISHPRFQGDMGWIGWGSGKEDQERPPRAFSVLVGWFCRTLPTDLDDLRFGELDVCRNWPHHLRMEIRLLPSS